MEYLFVEDSKDIEKTKNKEKVDESVLRAIELIKEILTDTTKTKDQITQEIVNILNKIQDLSSDVTHLKEVYDEVFDKKVNPRKRYESDQEYNDSLYNQVIKILDDVFSSVEGIFPEYQYLSSSITSFSKEGNILNGLINIQVKLDDFFKRVHYYVEVPVYIFDGFIYEPIFFTFENEPVEYSEESVKKIVGDRDYEPEYFDTLSFQGSNWSNMNKDENSSFKEKIPFKEEKKQYKMFARPQKIVDNNPRAWHVFNKPDMAPAIKENMSATPTYQEQYEYSLG